MLIAILPTCTRRWAWLRPIQGIAVLTVQHQVRDIETLVAELTPAFHSEVERLKRKA